MGMMVGVLVYFRNLAVVFLTREECEDRSHNTVRLSARIYEIPWIVFCVLVLFNFLHTFNCTPQLRNFMQALQLRDFMQALQLRNVTRRIYSRILK